MYTSMTEAHEEAEARANALRAEKMKGAKNPRSRNKVEPEQVADSGASPEAPLSKPPKKRTPKVAQVVAEQAGVSVRTAERALREHAKAEQEKPLPGHLPADHEFHAKRPWMLRGERPVFREDPRSSTS
jgi:hypothetical protein